MKDDRRGGPSVADGRGFTLVEVLVVLVVLGIVAALAIVARCFALSRALKRATMADMRSISRAIEAYSVDNGTPPPSSAGTVSELVPLLVPYQSSVLPHRDHWGHEILYERDGLGNYRIVSLGKDGADGPDISYDTRFEFDRDIVLANGQFIASPE